ncbi:MAG: hypothetical protein JMDDDDMK_00650 [Acidobacteria bacterium]|nr:hypothetical protein [Acidobacteriota bacterium]
MNCNQTREAVDTASRRTPYGDAVSSHLSGCLDCRRYADETNSLLMLLSAQPRVQAPADFDFRLRARIARAQAEKAHPAGLLERLWENFLAQTFSWGQAATAMAAVALVITVSTFYINHDKSAPVTGADVAIVNPVNPPQPKAPEVESPAVEAVRPAPVKFTGRSAKATPAMFRREAPTNSISSSDIASLDKSPRVYSRETRQFVPHRDTLIGAEVASVNLAKSAWATPTF